MRIRERLEKQEDAALAPWGMRSTRSRGRLYPAREHGYRTAFQRDRDRIIHARAFRRLQYKTQVFVHHEGDHFRNRLTHTLEVAQIARTVARAIGANEDLTEAIVLAHDLGHTPFGHAGERALHRLARQVGGFEHNRQSLRIVDLLEKRSSDYPGLNLTHVTRAGVLKHGSEFPRYAHPVALPDLGASPSAEAQVADVCDEIAYHNHDIDDGLRSGLLDPEVLREVRLWDRAWQEAASEGPGSSRLQGAGAIVRVIDALATDVIESSLARLLAIGVSSPEGVCDHPERLVGFSEEIEREATRLGRLLRENLYQHPAVLRMTAKGQRVLSDLWEAYTGDPRLLPSGALDRGDSEPRERAIVDYLAGMTDRFAIEEHRKLFDPRAQA